MCKSLSMVQKKQDGVCVCSHRERDIRMKTENELEWRVEGEDRVRIKQINKCRQY